MQIQQRKAKTLRHFSNFSLFFLSSCDKNTERVRKQLIYFTTLWTRSNVSPSTPSTFCFYLLHIQEVLLDQSGPWLQRRSSRLRDRAPEMNKGNAVSCWSLSELGSEILYNINLFFFWKKKKNIDDIPLWSDVIRPWVVPAGTGRRSLSLILSISSLISLPPSKPRRYPALLYSSFPHWSMQNKGLLHYNFLIG